jgi:hypothetical protein
MNILFIAVYMISIILFTALITYAPWVGYVILSLGLFAPILAWVLYGYKAALGYLGDALLSFLPPTPSILAYRLKLTNVKGYIQ